MYDSLYKANIEGAFLVNGKWIIFTVLLVTLLGVLLAWILLQVIPYNTEVLSLMNDKIMNTNEWITNEIT